MEIINFHTRINIGLEYIEAYAQINDETWKAYYKLYKAGQLSVAKTFLLCHPDCFDTLNSGNDQKMYQAKKELDLLSDYKDDTGFDRSESCESHKIWGGMCPVTKHSRPYGNHKIEFDHHFPRSFGGPTVPSNRIFLCKFHNQRIKTADIHLYPWEQGVPNWLHIQIEKITKFYNVK